MFSDEDLKVINDGGNKKQFQAEVNRLMEIIIHSLYTQRDIFLRELISNAGDALDKIRYKSLLDKEVLGENTDLEIMIRADSDANTLTITDTGVGMTKQELEDNLGTVARSGTAAFLDAFAQKSDDDGSNAMNLIGQFGVGFYSTFLVADEVTVVSKSNDDDQHVWMSKADGSYTVSKDPRGNTLGRGTSVTLTLKEDAAEYLDNDELERVVMRYSQFMQYPIKLWSSKKETFEVEPEEKDEDEDKEDETDDDEDEDLVAEDEDDDDDEDEGPKTEERTVWYWKQLNDQKPIWTRRPSQVEDSEYEEFYKTFAKGSGDNFLAKSHFRAEGEI